MTKTNLTIVKPNTQTIEGNVSFEFRTDIPPPSATQPIYPDWGLMTPGMSVEMATGQTNTQEYRHRTNRLPAILGNIKKFRNKNPGATFDHRCECRQGLEYVRIWRLS